MLLKCIPLLLLAQILIVAAKPTHPELFNSNDPQQKELERQAKEETVNLLNSLFRSQIAYFTEVKAQLNPRLKRAQDINLYVTRLNQAIAEKDMDKKDQMWLNIFDEFKGSPLLLNRESETGLSDMQYKILLTGQKLQDISTKFVTDVADYFWKMTKISGKVIDNSIANGNNA
ncbi:uncharacterized protein LOC128262160 [Drosophila gunungcola]|uniref:Uncharacterized protein n=1 Tax=Drosophila gunungcola TaxID=103775 RepID=A0A9Q0BRY9_9MUSC|nr:uncharacterized protein LOC128262160 [Drosophila gunungcola]KAI8041976.1 hypothetical protein M5D96_003274 [Drosophila gunungcola]